MDFFPLIRLNESKIRKEWVSEVKKTFVFTSHRSRLDESDCLYCFIDNLYRCHRTD